MAGSLNYFDPPDPDANRAADDVTGPSLDPNERVRRGFQQTRIIDRRADSPYLWLRQKDVFGEPTPFDPPRNNSYLPTRPALASDLDNPIAKQLGVRELEAQYQAKLRAAADAAAAKRSKKAGA